MSQFKKNLQKFFVYFFTSMSVVIVVLGTTRVKKGDALIPLNNDSSSTDSTSADGITIIDPSRRTNPQVRGTTAQASFTGKTVSTPWGTLATAIKVKDGKVVAVTIPSLPDSPPSIYAEPLLIAQALKSGGANIQGVSGATYTSRAFKASLENALAQAATTATSVASLPTDTGTSNVVDQTYSVQEPSVTVTPTTIASTPSQTTSTTKTASGVSGTFTGNTYQTPYGNVVASVTVANGKITAVAMPVVPNSPPSIQAEPYLVQQALAAGSANIQGVSGATYTSLAFKSSLESAITQANSTASSQGQTSVVATPSSTTGVATPAPASIPSIGRKFHHDDYDNERGYNDWDD